MMKLKNLIFLISVFFLKPALKTMSGGNHAKSCLLMSGIGLRALDYSTVPQQPVLSQRLRKTIFNHFEAIMNTKDPDIQEINRIKNILKKTDPELLERINNEHINNNREIAKDLIDFINSIKNRDK